MMMMLVSLLSALLLISPVSALSSVDHAPVSRAAFFRASIVSVAAAATTTVVGPANAAADKQLNLSDDKLKAVIKSDLVDNQFLVSGKITRSIYDAFFRHPFNGVGGNRLTPLLDNTSTKTAHSLVVGPKESRIRSNIFSFKSSLLLCLEGSSATS